MLELDRFVDRDAARAAIAAGAPVWIGVNPIEYHGPHLSLQNDRWCARGLALRLARRLHAAHGWDYVDGGEIAAGVEPVPGPGSVPVRFGEVRRRVAEACDAAIADGATRIVLSTFHGAPLHQLALDDVARASAGRGIRVLAPFHLVAAGLIADRVPEVDAAFDTIADPELRERVRAGLATDFHAGFFETSMALALAPGRVSPRWREVEDCPPVRPAMVFWGLASAARGLGAATLAAELEAAAFSTGWQGLRPFPGYTGRPRLASAEAGERFCEHLLALYAQAAEAVLVRGEAHPQPILRWVRPLTLGGRLPAIAAPASAVIGAPFVPEIA